MQFIFLGFGTVLAPFWGLKNGNFRDRNIASHGCQKQNRETCLSNEREAPYKMIRKWISIHWRFNNRSWTATWINLSLIARYWNKTRATFIKLSAVRKPLRSNDTRCRSPRGFAPSQGEGRVYWRSIEDLLKIYWTSLGNLLKIHEKHYWMSIENHSPSPGQKKLPFRTRRLEAVLEGSIRTVRIPVHTFNTIHFRDVGFNRPPLLNFYCLFCWNNHSPFKSLENLLKIHSKSTENLLKISWKSIENP